MQHFGDGRDWFFEKRFGLFVHWGIYALNAWQEQDHFRRYLPRAEYTALQHRFNPVRFDPEAWLDAAEAVGMRYLCFTTKHIDGFCMWDTALTDYKVTNAPYGEDTLALLAEACHRRNFPLCLYYSVVDEHQPNYPSANLPYDVAEPHPAGRPDLGKYVEFVRGQVRELCTRYGEIHGFWWDANVIKHQDPSINAMIRSLQPKAVINNRGFDAGDFGTPERAYDRALDEAPVFEQPTEACQSVGIESWGYREEEDYYTDAHLIRSIAKVMAKGGNYLLNVGPKADGTLPDEAVRILRAIGEWYGRVREGLDAAPAVGFVANPNVLLTRSGDTLYVVQHREPIGTAVILKPLDVPPLRATLLNTGGPVE